MNFTFHHKIKPRPCRMHHNIWQATWYSWYVRAWSTLRQHPTEHSTFHLKPAAYSPHWMTRCTQISCKWWWLLCIAPRSLTTNEYKHHFSLSTAAWNKYADFCMVFQVYLKYLAVRVLFKVAPLSIPVPKTTLDYIALFCFLQIFISRLCHWNLLVADSMYAVPT